MSLGDRWRRTPPGWKWVIWGIACVLMLTIFEGALEMHHSQQRSNAVQPLRVILAHDYKDLSLPLGVAPPPSSPGVSYHCIDELLPPGRTLQVPKATVLPTFWIRRSKGDCFYAQSDGSRKWISPQELDRRLDLTRRYLQENSKPLP